MDNQENYFSLAQLQGKVVKFGYKNWKHVRAQRMVAVKNVVFGTNLYHKNPTFLLIGLDIDRNENRTFDIRNIYTDIKILEDI